MKLPAYPRYKPSGVEWLGDVPQHWGVKRLGYVTQCLDGRRIPLNSEDRSDRRGNYPYWGANGIVDHIDDWLFDEPLVLLGEDGAPFFEQNKTVAFFVQGKIWVNNHAHVLRAAEQCEPRFLAYALNQTQFGAFIDGSTRDKLTQADMNSIPVACPPPAEQQAIAAFLDRETGRIGRLVAKKRELIERLKEKRTALISRTVTRGLPPAAARAAGLPENAPLKPSGLDWLGDVPNHWEVVRLKHLLQSRKAAVKTGPFGSQLQSAEMMDGDIKVYNQRSVLDRDFTGGDNYVSLEKFEELRAFEVFPDDLLVTTRGTIGRCAVLPKGAERGILHPCLMRVQFDARRVHSRFIEILIQDSGRVLEQLELKSNATTIDVIYSESLREVWFALPPIPEQAAIGAYLDEETAKLDALVAKVEEAVERLQEYRTALITAAVTGKIDVRKATA